jgi:hypothetical protein
MFRPQPLVHQLREGFFFAGPSPRQFGNGAVRFKEHEMKCSDIHPNEIRDYLQRAPKRWSFDGKRMTNHTGARLKWLHELCRGTLDERINRRAGLVDEWRPFCNPVHSAIRRKERRNKVIAYGRMSAKQARRAVYFSIC